MAVADVSEWWSIEVFDSGELPARRWKDSYQDQLTQAAITHGATYWEWHEHRYGVVFEVLFDSGELWEAFRAWPTVRAALDGAPDPVNGLIVYRGRGGGAGPRKPRKPRPAPGASAMAMPEPADELFLELTGVSPPGMPEPDVGRPVGSPSIGARSAARGRIRIAKDLKYRA